MGANRSKLVAAREAGSSPWDIHQRAWQGEFAPAPPYCPDQVAMCRRAAVFVDKILKGSNPAELPVEEPTKVEFLINLKTAGALGISIPYSLLANADEVIE